MSLYFNENECFNVRLHSSQIETIVNALKIQRNSLNLDPYDYDNEINVLIDMFKNVENDTLNSFVD